MTLITIHSSPTRLDRVSQNPLPTILHTPSGFALLELQGTINIPSNSSSESMLITDHHDSATTEETPIGRLVFPDYEEGVAGQECMKTAYLYVGNNQRLTGEVKKLPKALAIIRKRDADTGVWSHGVDDEAELEIVDLVRFKIVFASRPEPVGVMDGSDAEAEAEAEAD